MRHRRERERSESYPSEMAGPDTPWIGAPQNELQEVGRWRILGVVAAGLVILVILFVRLAYLQIGSSRDYLDAVDRNRFRYVQIPAPRGAIVDRNGRALVSNVPNFTLLVIPASMPSETDGRAEFVERLAAVAGISAPEIENDIARKLAAGSYSSSDAVPILSHIEYGKALKMAVSLEGLSGVLIEAFPSRSYVQGVAAAPVVGYIGAVTTEELEQDRSLRRTDEVGKTGIEWKLDRFLRGRAGYVAYERTGNNQFLSPVRHREPEPGHTVELTVDRDLQGKVFSVLNSQIRRMRLKAGAAVAVDPRTGEILSLVSYPTYDSNWFVDPTKLRLAQESVRQAEKPLLNRVISGQYPSGSIIKPIIAAAALAERIVTPATTFLSVGGFTVGRDHFPDWKSGGHGVTDLKKAIAESVNTYFYIVGGGFEEQRGLGVERIVKYLGLFGWGGKLGIELPGEQAGLLPTRDWRERKRATPWRLGDTYHLAIGQGDVQVTPLQVAMSTSAFANGGTLYRPEIVKSIRDANGDNVSTAKPEVVRSRFIEPSVVRAVREGMREGVLSGSSRALQDLPVSAAGKTGTAQFGSTGQTHSWYTVFAPYDRPVIALTVIVEAGGEGNSAALPVAHEVLRWYFREGGGRQSISTQ